MRHLPTAAFKCDLGTCQLISLCTGVSLSNGAKLLGFIKKERVSNCTINKAFL